MDPTMEQVMSSKSEITSEKSEMSELVFASRMMRERIAPAGSADSKGERLRNAANVLRWKYSLDLPNQGQGK